MRTACRCSALSIAACSLTTLLASLWQTLVLAAPVADEVLSLPGWHGPLPSKQYSGFLDVSPTAHLHYVFVEASSDSPETAPVVGLRCNNWTGFRFTRGPHGAGFMAQRWPWCLKLRLRLPHRARAVLAPRQRDRIHAIGQAVLRARHGNATARESDCLDFRSQRPVSRISKRRI
eukprot:SAG31_NODE_67_length_28318_cov_6.493674_14_plen_175_part_00